MTCLEIQQKLTQGELLGDVERDHVLICANCAAVAAASATLDATLAELDAAVPEGFADRVMARIALEVRGRVGVPARANPAHWYEQRWAGIVLSSAAALVAILNVARFVAAVLVPAGWLGGAP